MDNMAELQAHLREQGLNLSQFTVDVAPDNPFNGYQAQHGGRHGARPQAPSVNLGAKAAEEGHAALDRVKMGLNAVDLLA